MRALRKAVESGEWVVLDTETTGLDHRSEVIQIGVLGADGETVLDTLVRPTGPIPSDATAIHGLTDADVADAPSIVELLPQILAALQCRHVLVYNARFDIAMLEQSTRAHGLDIDWSDIPASWTCAMRSYAEYRGERGRNGYRSHGLGKACRHERIPVRNAHNALADCRMTRALVLKITGSL